MAIDICLSQQLSLLRASYDFHLPKENMPQQLLPRRTVLHEIILNGVKSQLSGDNLPRTLEFILPRTTWINYNLNKLLDIPSQTQNTIVLLH